MTSKPIASDTPVFSIPYYREQIQSHAECNCGRELTEVELYRLAHYWMENLEIEHSLLDVLQALLTDVMDNNGNRWQGVDEQYLAAKGQHYGQDIT